MNFRVTPNYIASQLVFFNQSHSAKLANLQFQASTGLRITRPSDDPGAVEQLFSLNRTLTSLDTENENIQHVEHTLNISVTNLTDVHEILRSAQRIALEARQADPSTLEVLAIEVDRLGEQLVQLANSTENGRYLYGGQNDQIAPYASNPVGDFPPYIYQGSLQALTVNISTNVQVDTLYNGSQIFGTPNRQTSVFIGSTGAQPGLGTDNAVSRGTLSVIHDSTSYAAGSGVASGTSSATGDTIIGAAGDHTVEINDTSGTGAFGTISLNGGNPVDWTSADTDLQVKGPLGELVFVDTSNITAGFSGTVDATADGSLSTDSGATSVPIDFSTNQTIFNSETGLLTNVDSSQVRYAGVDQIDYRGTSDAISTLAELSADLRDSRNLSRVEFSEAIIRHDENIERHAETVLRTIGEQAVSLEAMVSLSDRNRNYHLEVSSVAADIESADLTEVVVQLQQEQNLLEYSYAVSSAILGQNILDFLR